MRRAPLLLLVAACAREGPPAVTVHAAPATFAVTRWAEMTRSPWPASGSDGVLASCGEADAALDAVAKELVAARTKNAHTPETEEVVALLRAQGEPHVRPRVVTASGRAPINEELLRAQLESVRGEHTRCGMARAPSTIGREIVLTVAIDALADLAPLPTRARTGEWLTLDASFATRAQGASVILLGPRGLPRTVPSTFEQGHVRARFALDRPGAFTVQVLGDLEHGPQPVLEARIFADVEPTIEETTAPGEELGATNDAAALFAMLGAVRASERLAPVTRDEELDKIAQAHATKMLAARRVAHDLGSGDLKARILEANIEASAIAENVARASSVTAAHRTLHASPSHRLNMLGSYKRVGIGIAQEGESTYACEVFAR